MAITQKSFIEENSLKFRKKKCPQHKLSYFQKVCTHSNCVESIALSLLCNQCCRKHPENHNGLIQYYLEFDKIFSENVFIDIELLEHACLDVFQEKKKRLDQEIDKNCDVILNEVKQLLESIKSRAKLKYTSNDLVDTIMKLKESLKEEYDTLFSIDEANIQDQNIKRYLEFYVSFEKMLEQNQAKSEEIYESIEKEFNSVSQLFNQKLNHIRSILESDTIE